MPAHDYLRLHLFRLKPGVDWGTPGEGLHFLLPQAGAGEYISRPSSGRSLAQPLEPGDVLVLGAGSGGKVRAAAWAEFVSWAFSVRLEHLFPLFMPDEISVVQTLMDTFKTARFYAAASPATIGWHELIRNVPSEFSLAHRGQLLRMAAAVLSEEFRRIRPPGGRGPRPDERMIRLFERVSAEEILDLSLDDLAGRFSCSRRHLNRLFHQHFGLSVAALRMEMRLLKAVSLLRNPGPKLITLAKECGFNHLGLFNSCFKRRFGLSPGQWRKNLETDRKPAPMLAAADPNCRLRVSGLCPLLGSAEVRHPGASHPSSVIRGP